MDDEAGREKYSEESVFRVYSVIQFHLFNSVCKSELCRRPGAGAGHRDCGAAGSGREVPGRGADSAGERQDS